MAQLACFSTTDIAPPERLARWDAELWKPVAPFRTQSVDPVFEGNASFARIGPIHLLRIAASAHRLERDDRAPGLGRRGLATLIVQRSGASTITQYGRQMKLEPGAWTICDADRPFSLTSMQAGEQLILLLPRDRLGIGTVLTGYIARDFGASGGTARLLPRYLSSLLEELGSVADGNCGELADMAAQLVRLALFEARQAAPPISMRETLRLRVKDYVRRNLRDPALSIDRVAAAFGCTKRHLHKVFTGDETTLSQFIWTQRLENCRDALENPHLTRQSVTEIAFMWGFNNSAHFSKAFKERFGLPPGSFRERAIEPRGVHALLQVA
jgi:AraC-like DNA-binding protein